MLQQMKVSTKIFLEYIDYTKVFSKDLAIELLKNNRINNYAIELIKGKRSPYRPIHSLDLAELEMLKAYIETHLKTRFIQLSKPTVSILIFFYKKPKGNLSLFVNYQGFNNFTVKN